MVSIDLEKWKRLSELGNRDKTKKAFECISVLGVEAVLIKGWVNSRFYDTDHVRTYTDVDIAISPSSDEYTKSIIRKTNYPGIIIDLHIGLRHLDKLSWSELFKRSYITELDGTPIRILADEDNLRITSVHWLIDGGINKEKLWDIYYLVKNRRASFDWETCLNSNGPVRRTWVNAAIATARDFLELDVSALPKEIRNFRLPKWYLRTLEKEWKRGPYSRRILSAVVMRPKLLAEQIYRRFPPNPIAATIEVEAPIDESWRPPVQLRSLLNKVGPFAKGVWRRMGENRGY